MQQCFVIRKGQPQIRVQPSDPERRTIMHTQDPPSGGDGGRRGSWREAFTLPGV